MLSLLLKTIIVPFLVLFPILTPSNSRIIEREAIKSGIEVVDTQTPPIPQLYAKLRVICSCESNGHPNGQPRQFSNGQVLKGQINQKDIGACQISTQYWLEKSKELGYDIYTEEGNYKMANWIFENYGDEPWDASRFCWQKR